MIGTLLVCIFKHNHMKLEKQTGTYSVKIHIYKELLVLSIIH
jgi:hypothetical protein